MIRPQNLPAPRCLEFQVTYIDYYGYDRPVIRHYGTTADGRSVCLHIHGFHPFFYIRCPTGISENALRILQKKFNRQLNRLDPPRFSKDDATYVDRLEVVRARSIKGYRADQSLFLRIVLFKPRHVALLRDQLREETFESDYPFVLRYMTSRKAYATSWVTAPEAKDRYRRQSTCQLEYDCKYDTLEYHEPVDTWKRNAPLLTLSLDIECAAHRSFPTPERDPVIQIAVYVQRLGDPSPCYGVVLCLHKTAVVTDVDAKTISFGIEHDLLVQFARIVQSISPDVLTGYNTSGFDIPYLVKRSKILGIEEKDFVLGRLRDKFPRLREQTFTSKAYGTSEQETAYIPGVVQFDLLPYIKRNFKYRSYSLNAVASNILDERKEDVPYGAITSLWKGTAATRSRLAKYCLKDALLPLRIIEKQMLLVNQIEMSRVCWVPLEYLFTKGQTVKVRAQIQLAVMSSVGYTYRYLIPYNERDKSGGDISAGDLLNRNEKYKGATVLEPQTGYYGRDKPVTTLDFASLYPSIMIAHNLCYSTQITEEQAANMNPDDYERTPAGHLFVRKHVRKGILPTVLENLLTNRKAAKRRKAQADTNYEATIWDATQGALKTSANSVYGFTGATKPGIPISESVTAYGREMIELSKKVVEEHITGSKVIYGDTDSIMVLFGVGLSVAKCMEMGAIAADLVNKHFVSPISLLFEKVMMPFLLLSKKRYISLFWLKPDKYDHLDFKGVEVKRRDCCMLVNRTLGTCAEIVMLPAESDSETDQQKWRRAIEYVRTQVRALYTGDYDMADLVISKNFSRPADQYKSKQTHIELMKRMKQRDPLTAPRVGERIPYVMIGGVKNMRACDKSEDPIYALQHRLPIDINYYIEQQLLKPLTRFFTPYFAELHRRDIDAHAGTDKKKRKERAQKYVVEALFSGEHTRRRVHTTANVGIAGFFKPLWRCPGCREPSSTTDFTLCKKCEPHRKSIRKKLDIHYDASKQKHDEIWKICYDCQDGDIESAERCIARDCDNFFPRHRAEVLLQDAKHKLDW